MTINHTITKSRFYAPCLKALQQVAPTPLGVAQIIEAVYQNNPDNNFRSCNGGVRALLLRMSTLEESPIIMVEGTQPPQFYVESATQNAAVNASAVSQSRARRCNSIFYQPACEILKAHAPEAMSANEVTKAIIEEYPQLEWSHSQGPIRAMLLKAAQMAFSPIKQIVDVLPPQFVYQEINTQFQTEEVPEASDEEIMSAAFAKTQATIKDGLLQKIMELDATSFEHLANRLVAKMLFGDSEDTPPSGDGGIDGYINIYADPLGLNTVGVQAKHYTAGENVQRPEIQQFIGALHGKNGVFVTCSDFSSKAKQEAERSSPSKIVLMNGSQLVENMIRYKIGVRETDISYTLNEIDLDFFDEL